MYIFLALNADLCRITGKAEPRVEIIGYIGSYVNQHLAIESFLSGDTPCPEMVAAFADPTVHSPGQYASREVLKTRWHGLDGCIDRKK